MENSDKTPLKYKHEIISGIIIFLMIASMFFIIAIPLNNRNENQSEGC
ncbi:MAG: hypothetical protein ACTSPQ_21550 [Candidatus Helarchaeota archaeon]